MFHNLFFYISYGPLKQIQCFHIQKLYSTMYCRYIKVKYFDQKKKKGASKRTILGENRKRKNSQRTCQQQQF